MALFARSFIDIDHQAANSTPQQHTAGGKSETIPGATHGSSFPRQSAQIARLLHLDLFFQPLTLQILQFTLLLPQEVFSRLATLSRRDATDATKSRKNIDLSPTCQGFNVFLRNAQSLFRMGKNVHCHVKD